jgi:methionine-gamma-lyase
MRDFLGALEIITPAVSLGSTDSLIQPPAALTHRVVEESAREAVGISRGLLRLSVGLEDARDLWRDLDHALAEVASRLEMRPREAALTGR